MKTPKPKHRTEASKPEETQHLTEAQKRALDLQDEAEHADGKRREDLTQKISSKQQ